MDQTKKLLFGVAENSEMGAKAAEKLLDKTADHGVSGELRRQAQAYRELRDMAEERLISMGETPRDKGFAAKAGMWMGMEMETLTDKSPSHIADMSIQGATMGVVELTKLRNECTDADADAQGLASRFITEQQTGIDNMKRYL